jgi:DNA-binding GntR family transcriptional regulator
MLPEEGSVLTQIEERLFSPVGRERVVDQIYDEIRQAILDQAFNPGDRLEVDELAKMFDVSLTPVRQALQTLNAVGLVEIRPRSGTFVARLSSKDIADNFDVRRSLECLAAETAVTLMPGAAVERMERLDEEMCREPINSKADREQHDIRNTEFHRLIIEHSGNRRIREIYDDVSAQIKIARFHLVRNEWTVGDSEQIEHGEILSSMQARDGGRLITALTNHINRSKDALQVDLQRVRMQRIDNPVDQTDNLISDISDGLART